MASFQWANDDDPLSLTSKFILPDEKRPNLTQVTNLDSIPVINMNENEEDLAQRIAKACEEFGFFQVINHGVPKQLCNNVLDAITQLFELPHEEKAQLVTTTPGQDGSIYRYYVKDGSSNEMIALWSETFFHTWHPVDDSFTNNLPKNPPQYREVVAAYIKHIGSLIRRLLSLMSKGLGLEKDHLERILGENPRRTAQANYYPPCPDPELAMGLTPHTDLPVLTLLLQEEGVTGLHVTRNANWMAVDPIPGALVINVGDQLQVLSNDRYKSVRHRAVTNKEQKRISYAIFCGPNLQETVGPIEELIDEDHPALYRNFTFGEFLQEFRKQEGQERKVKEVFRIL